MQRLFFLRPLALGLGLLLSAIGGVQAQTPSPEGISFYVLRVIYAQSDKQGASLTAYNKTPLPYLMQSRIQPVDLTTGDMATAVADQATMPFVVTPPLARMEANGELTLRIRRNGEPLPSDRESVFFISMKAIPAQAPPEKTAATGKMVLTVTNNMKVFYRPDGLEKRAVADAAPKLRFRQQGDVLVADNPTPYWLTFSRLDVGSHSLDKKQLRLMVPPKGQQQYRLPAGTRGAVSWKLIDEDGWDTPVQQQPL